MSHVCCSCQIASRSCMQSYIHTATLAICLTFSCIHTRNSEKHTPSTESVVSPPFTNLSEKTCQKTHACAWHLPRVTHGDTSLVPGEIWGAPWSQTHTWKQFCFHDWSNPATLARCSRYCYKTAQNKSPGQPTVSWRTTKRFTKQSMIVMFIHVCGCIATGVLNQLHGTSGK